MKNKIRIMNFHDGFKLVQDNNVRRFQSAFFCKANGWTYLLVQDFIDQILQP